MRRAPLLFALLVSCSSAPGASHPRDPDPGDVALARDMQHTDEALERDLRAALEGLRFTAAAVALDVSTGEVIAVAERAGGDGLKPLEVPHHPGSSVKPLLMLAALDAQAVAPDHTVECTGTVEWEGQQLTCFDEHGDLDIVRALATSCNAFAYDVAEAMGMAAVTSHYRELGLVGPGEEVGMAEAVGHGTLRVRPETLARVYREALVLHSSPNRALVIEGMKAAVASGEGSARAARMDDLEIAGKTGTAVLDDGAYEATFVALVPADDPQLVLVTYAQGGGTAPESAVPMAAEIIRRWQARR